MRKILFTIFVLVLFVFLIGCKEEPVACTLEAKICPDGSTVGRNPNNNCEFDPCPDFNGTEVCEQHGGFCKSITSSGWDKEGEWEQAEYDCEGGTGADRVVCWVPEIPTECTTDDDCAITGCSGIGCQPKDAPPMFSTCEWKEEYACYKEVTCGCVGGVCMWKEQDKLQQCIEEKQEPKPVTKWEVEIIEVNAGETFDINLESNPSTGYSWVITEMDETLLEFIGETFQLGNNCQEGMAGCGGTTTMTFRAKAAGETMLKLVYCHSWECEDTIEDRKTYSLVITNYVCPDMETINCMPIVPNEQKRYCYGAYHDWIEENCPNIGFTY